MNDFVLDPGARIPDPPDDESKLLDWAREITETLRSDHVDNVDRTETMIMMDNGITKRPEARGSRRMFHDQNTGTLYIDAVTGDETGEWVPINNVPTWQADGRGVQAIYSTSLPYTAGTTGTFSFDEEVYDENNYWTNTSPTRVTYQDSGAYQIVFHAQVTGITSGQAIAVWHVLNGIDQDSKVERQGYQVSDGPSEVYDLNFSFIEQDMNAADYTQIKWGCEDASWTLSDCYIVVTPMTQSGGGGGDVETVHSHGDLLNLTADDHLQYLLASAAGGRSQFSTYWTDLTDGGSTLLHYHSPIRLDHGDSIQWRDNTDSSWLGFLAVTGVNEDFAIGRTASDILLYASDKTDAITGTWDADAGYIDIDSSNTFNCHSGGAFNIGSTGGNVTIDAVSDVYIDGNLKLDQNTNYMYGTASGTGMEYTILGLTGTNEVFVGNTGLNCKVYANTRLDLGQYESGAWFEDADQVYVKSIGYETFTHSLGSATDTFFVGNSARDMRVIGTNTTIDGNVRIDYINTGSSGTPTYSQCGIADGQWCVAKNTSNEVYVVARQSTNTLTVQLT